MKQTVKLSYRFRKNMVKAFAGLTAFSTTYALILPAITIDQETAEEDPGIVFTEEENVNALDTYTEIETPEETIEETIVETVQEETVSSEPSVEQESQEEIVSEPQTTEEYSEQNEIEETPLQYVANTLEYESKDDYKVVVKYDESLGLTENAALEVKEIVKEDNYINCLEAFKKQYEKKENVYEITYARFFNVNFLNNGAYTEVTGKTENTFTFDESYELKEDEELKIFFVDTDGNYQEYDEKENKVSFKYDEENKVKEISFEDREGLNNFAITVIQSVEEKQEAESEGSIEPEEETTVEETEETVIEETVVEESEKEDSEITIETEENHYTAGTLSEEGKDYSVTLSYNADAQIEEGSTLFVREIIEDSKTHNEYLEEAQEKVENISYARFFDITILDKEGNPYEPKASVDVKITIKDAPAADAVKAVHFTEEQTEVIDTETNDEEVSFIAESFSVYGVVYTVDFHYEANGQTYDFSIPGGGFVSFEHLVEVLGLTAADADENVEEVNEESISLNETEVSEATKNFVAEVESITFSSPELADVSQVSVDTTIGQIKESRGLEVEYAADLSEEQIAEINENTVREGDWVLISLQPFISEETLTVTMKNGDAFMIQVTDAQIRTQYLSDNGDLYEITVYYDEEAGIPEDASLQVIPYEYESEEYSSIRNIVFEQLETEQEDKLLALDISIINADGQAIEPESAVRVEMVMKNLKEELEIAGDTLSVLHLNTSSGEVVVETVANADDMANIRLDEETATATFTLNSFSQFAIKYGNYVQVNVHYVDVNGNELTGSTSGVTASANNSINLDGYASRMTKPGYSYLGAHYGLYSGLAITSLKATTAPTAGSLTNRGQSITFYNGSEIVARQEYDNKQRLVDVYLVYAPSTGYYIMDTIGEDGCLTVQNGTDVIETGIDQNLFVRWYRSSNSTTDFQEVTQSKILNGNYNLPELGGAKVNVSIDEGADKYYKAEIYKVEDNQEVVLATTEPYHVPYYDDVRNGGFETPQNNGSIN
ncbi:MAG: hypothetical protein IKR11_13400, partial [Solobacterium sp.]|nr:hypothetical protein [Solobacterium sp.]